MQKPQSPPNKITPSPGLGEWLKRHVVSFAFTSYDSGQLFFVGSSDRGCNVNFSNWQKPMGLAVSVSGSLALGTANHIYTLEPETKQTRADHDAIYIPRVQSLTGQCDAHELAYDKRGDLLFANTRYSCIAALSDKHHFTPVWKPDFISSLVSEDRCHLNGLGMRDGEPRFVSLCSMSDSLHGWRGNRVKGGAVFDIQTGKAVETDCHMPHSPRWHENSLWFLNSGEGWIYNGKSAVAFCPGFLRGLAFHENYALTTVSLPREGLFKGLPLQDELERRRGDPWCAVLIVNLDTGAIEEYLRIEGATKELFDVQIIPFRSPMAISAHDPQLWSFVTFDKPQKDLTIPWNAQGLRLAGEK